MGVFAIADLIEREGFGVKMLNYPLEDYLNHNWSLADYLKTIDFDTCGIDLHWIHNAHGAIEVAKIVKEVNPNARVILGGFSASYYHEQILKYYKNVDGVIKGEGEIPLLNYIQNFKKNQPFDSVPNLSYRNSSNHIKVNPISYVAKNLDDLNFVNVSLLHNAQQYLECSRRLMGISLNLPIGRGCPFNCPYCGGGQRAQIRNSARNKVILRSPEKVVEDIREINDNYKIPSIFFGHGTYPGTFKYWKQIFSLIKEEKIDIAADLEIWRLPFPRDMWEIFSKTFRRKYSSVSISPRTTSERAQYKIRKICDPTFKFPKNQINDLIKNSSLYNRILRIWLTIGFPFQKRVDVLKDYQYAIKCGLKYGTSHSTPVTMMNEPFYIFPGSPAHESPEKFGIKLKYTSFPEVVNSFKHTKTSYYYNVINYDTKSLSSLSIKVANLILLLSTANMFLTT